MEYSKEEQENLLEVKIDDEKVNDTSILEKVNFAEISSQIKKLMKDNKLVEALSLCSEYQKYNIISIESQKVKILLLLFRQTEDYELLSEAKNICNEHVGNKIFDNHMRNIKNNKLTVLLTKIYCGVISKEEIENSDIGLWEKHLLLVAYFDKNNKKNGVLFLKSIKPQYQDIPEKKKIINVLLEKLISKKQKLFTTDLYCGYLKCSVDSTLADIISKKKDEISIEKVIENNITNNEVKDEVIKSDNSKKEEKKVKSNMISSVGTTINRYNQNSIEKNNDNCKTKNNQSCIRDLYVREVLDIENYLYIKMHDLETRRMAIIAWDNFECLISKSSNDIEALNRMLALIKRLNSSDLVSNRYKGK